MRARAIRQRHSAPSRCCARSWPRAGLLAITVPVGYNTAFDAALRSGQVPLHRAVALRRAGGTRWREVAPAEVWSAPYDFLLYRARGVLFGFIEAPAG